MSLPPSRSPPADARLSVFANPLEGWRNDDILFTESARDALAARHPEAARVLDWPELRDFFKAHENPANTHGQRDRRFGLMAVLLGAAGLVLTAFAPLADSSERLVGLAAVALTLFSAGLASAHWLQARTKSRWLGNRYLTERARALYFQILANHLELAAAAMQDQAALAQWKAKRARALQLLPLNDLPARVRALIDDVADAAVWVDPDWAAPPPIPVEATSLELLFKLLKSQRFDIQVEYSSRKLGESLVSPRRRSQAARSIGDLLTYLAIGSAAAVGGLLSFGLAPDHLWVKGATAFAATASAGVLALRAMGDGLNLQGDAARYAWYCAATQRARAQFEHGDVAGKVAALREMEMLAYRELRDFISGHKRARYLM